MSEYIQTSGLGALRSFSSLRPAGTSSTTTSTRSAPVTAPSPVSTSRTSAATRYAQIRAAALSRARAQSLAIARTSRPTPTPTVRTTAPRPTPTARPAPTTRRTSTTRRAPAPTRKPPVTGKERADAQAQAKVAVSKSKAASKRRGPPPWANANAHALRDADGKVARAMTAGIKKVIDKLPLSAEKKSQLKASPISFLVAMAEHDPKGVSDFIQTAKNQGASVASPSSRDNPAALAAKLVTAAATKPSAAMQAATRHALAFSGYAGLGTLAMVKGGAISSFNPIDTSTSTSSVTKESYVALMPALTALSPITLSSLKTLSLGTTTKVPTPTGPVTTTSFPPIKPVTPVQIAETVPAVEVAETMIEEMPPKAKAVAEEVAKEEDKILGLPRNAVLIGGGVGVLGLVLLLLKRKG